MKKISPKITIESVEWIKCNSKEHGIMVIRKCDVRWYSFYEGKAYIACERTGLYHEDFYEFDKIMRGEKCQ